jgi:hypothetical protein
MAPIFTAPGAWSGGFYTLALEYELFDLHTDDAVRRLWQHPALEGCYASRDQEPEDQPRIPAEFNDPRTHLYGVATLPGGAKVPCGCLLWLFGEHPDWIELYIPMAALEKVYPTGAFPYEGPAGEAWQQEVDDWFAVIARHVYRGYPFQMAAIGFEVNTPDLSAAKVRSEGMKAFGVSSYLLPSEKGLAWHPVSRKPTIELP